MTSLDETTLKELIQRARAAASRAYCPYSRFRVGAAVLTASGAVFDGCNVENASYGLTCCAERNALFQMVVSGNTKLAAVVIYTPTAEPTAPCGACRQVINEFGPDALVVSTCDGPAVHTKRLSELLPGAFGPANLGG